MNDNSDHDHRTDSRATTQTERSEAMLAHLLTIFLGFLAPAVIYFAKRKSSRFVGFHALQALLWHLSWVIVFAGAVLALLVTVGFGATHQSPSLAPEAAHHGAVMPISVTIAFFGCWLLLMGGWLVTTCISVYVALKANSGHWTRYPLIGARVARMAHYEEAAESSR